jgi:hypothetical protein
MNDYVTKGLLAAGTIGAPVTQFAIKHMGRTGAIVGAAGCGALLVRDAFLFASGTTHELKRGPAGLLDFEVVIGAVALGLTIRLILDDKALKVAMGGGRSTPDIVRRLTTAAMYGIHTARYTIYLRPDQGRRAPTAEAVA